MHQILRERAATHPDRTAVVFDDRTLTYGDLDRDARRVASALDRRGVRSGDVALLAISNRSELLIAMFALAHLGAVAAPVNFELNGASLAHVLDILGARVAIAEAAFLPRLEAARGGWGGIEHVIHIGSPAVDPHVRTEPFEALLEPGHTELAGVVAVPSSPWLIIFTSGTTGASKGVVLPHQQVASAAWDAMQDGQLDESSVFYTFLPTFHLNAIVFGPLAAILSGSKAVVRHTFPRDQLLEDLKATGATHWTAVAYVLRGLLGRPEQPDDNAHRLRWTLALGTTVQEVEEFERRFGCPVYSAYGATESGMICAAQPARLGTAGRIRDRHEVRIVNVDGTDVPRGTVGEIWSRARQPYDRMLGYYNMRAETMAAFSGEWFKTGDRAWVDDYDQLHFFDRVKEMVKRRGENVSTQEVENVLLRFPGVTNAAVVGFQATPESDEEIRAFIEVAPNAAAHADFAAILEHCSRHLARFMLPRFIEVVTELPRNAVGKIEKQKLKQRPLAAGTFDSKAAGLSRRT